MRGEFIAIWSETCREIWDELADDAAAPIDMFCELYRELAPVLKQQPSVEELAEIIAAPEDSYQAFRKIRPEQLRSERELVAFFENAHGILEDLAGDEFSNFYFHLLGNFIDKYSLRYDLQWPCTLSPTLPGMFASLVHNLRTVTSRNAHLDALMKEFEDAIRDLRNGCSDGRIKTCIQKQVNLLEALGRACPGVTQTTLGAICDQVGTWPHEKIKDSIKNLYGFACDYPGIRHGGTVANSLRAIEMRDMVAMSILLAGFATYLTDQLDADVVYRGS